MTTESEESTGNEHPGVAGGNGGNPSVELEDVTKRFDELVAVNGIDLALQPGEFFTLLGPSGCGKTTTLRMVAGFEEPPPAGADRRRRRGPARPPPPDEHGVSDLRAVPPPQRARERRLRAAAQEGREGEISRRVAAELDRVGLAGEINRRPRSSRAASSSGWRSPARSSTFKVLLLDEPLGALDLKLRKGLQIELKRIQREVGITFVYVTHDQEEALTMSDRIAVMNRGAIEQIGVPEDVYERPETTFVAGFIGVSNLMPGTVASVNGGLARVRLESGVEVEASGNRLATGERCHAVVRPGFGSAASRSRPPTARRASRAWSTARSTSAPRPRSSFGCRATFR